MKRTLPLRQVLSQDPTLTLDAGKKGSVSRRKSYYNDLINKATSAKKKFELEMLKIDAQIVPEGNASDSGQLDAMIEQQISNTTIQPKIISTDDGYANTAVRDKWIEKGVEVFSISGSKGKRLTPEEDWDSDMYREARNNRSAVESLMFCIKFSFNFGRNMRRGIENVRNEMLEKVLAYNFARMVKIRQRQLLAA